MSAAANTALSVQGNNFLSRGGGVRKLAYMKIVLSLIVLALSVGVVSAQNSAPSAPVASVASVETSVQADIIEDTGDPRGLNDESDVTGLVLELQEKEAQLLPLSAASTVDEVLTEILALPIGRPILMAPGCNGIPSAT